MNCDSDNFIEMATKIAIVGMSCRLPGANDLREFWRNLVDGIESVRASTSEELQLSGLPREILEDSRFITACGRLDGVEEFDAAYFGMTKSIAEITAPQQRLLLELSQHALDDSGYCPENFSGRIGIYTAIESSDYERVHLLTRPDLYDSLGEKNLQLVNDIPFSATQVAYKLNLNGPAVGVTTACSSSLVAVHMACKSLLAYEADMMLAGGASYSVNQHTGYLYRDGGIASRDGHCRPFDKDASGTVNGNGGGMVVLKRLADAINDGDSIYAVIEASAINNDGGDKVNYSAPGIASQSEVISEALDLAGINADQVSYVETHGTGTLLGDPIEIAALTEAFREHTQKRQYCALGAVKANLGHLGCAAGVAGLIKTALALYHRQIPPAINFSSPNPKLNIEDSPFYITSENRYWSSESNERIAGVSSFGMGGTNAHVILSGREQQAYSDCGKPVHVIPISAKTQRSLDENVRAVKKFIEENDAVSISDVAFTLQSGRKLHPFRQAFTLDSRSDIGQQIKKTVLPETGATTAPKRLFMMFPGQGNQWAGMAKSLYDHESVFRDEADHCFRYLQDKHDLQLRSILFDSPVSDTATDNKLKSTRFAQIGLFVVEYALAKTLLGYGIKPEAMIGHSIGEYVAATLAGVFSLDDALTVVVRRGQLMQALPEGGMAAVALAETELKAKLPDLVDVAAVNRNDQTIVSGPTEVITAFIESLAKEGIAATRLHTSHAFHSRMMDGCLNDFRQLMKGIKLNKPAISFFSNVHGRLIANDEAGNPEYWITHLRQPVKFFEGLQNMLQGGEAVCLEVGPGNSIATVFSSHSGLRDKSQVFNCMSSHNKAEADITVFTKSLAMLWQSGIDICWASAYRGERRRRVHLPGYIFDKQRYWIEKSLSSAERIETKPALSSAHTEVSGKSTVEDNWLYIPCWEQTILPSATALQDETWMLVGNNELLHNALEAQLQCGGKSLVRVKFGEHYSHEEENLFLVNPERVDHFKKVLTALPANTHKKLIYGVDNAESCNPGQERQNFYHAVNLYKAIEETDSRENSNLLVIGSGTTSLSDEDRIKPAMSMMVALCRSVNAESGKTKWAFVDVQDNIWRNSVSSVWQARLLITECRGGLDDAYVSYRGSGRFVVAYKEVESVPHEQSIPAFKTGEVYVITGGLSGIGYEIAKHLAEKYSARLILLSRNAPSYPGPEHLPKAGSDSVQKIACLESLGAEVCSFPVDVSNRKKLQLAFAQAEEQLGRIAGVIHAAGVAGGGMLAIKDNADFEATFAAKVEGTESIIDYLRDKQPDFIFLFSSLNAIKSAPARADYAAANAYMDAMAAKYSIESGLPVVSCNWGGWKETGMLHDLLESKGNSLSDEVESLYFSIDEGIRIFENAMGLGLANVVASKTPVSRSLQYPVVDKPEQPTTVITGSEDVKSDNICRFESGIRRTLAGIWSDTLGTAPVSDTQNFFECGGNSLLASQVVFQIQRKFDISFSLSQFLQNPTISATEREIIEIRAGQEDLDVLEEILSTLEQATGTN